MKTISKLQVILMLLSASSMNVFAQTSQETIQQLAQETSSNNTIGWGLIILLIIQIFVVRSLSSAIKTVSNSDIVTKSNNHLSGVWLIGGLLLSFQTYAQGVATSDSFINFSDTDIYILITLNVLLSVIVMWMYYQFKQILKFTGWIKQEKEKSTSTWWNLEHLLTRTVPIEKEASIQFEHEYDGIKELDNVLPPWWLWMFYTTLVFAVIYLIHYHISPIKALENIGFVGPGAGQEELYKKEMEQAEKEKQAYLAQAALKVNEDNVIALTDASELSKGKEIFNTNCVVCHGQQGEGGAGSNLTDNFWLHGCSIKEVFKTIKYGVPAKGMIAWETQLSPLQIQQVASYVLSLKGTNPAGAKEPQGEKCEN